MPGSDQILLITAALILLLSALLFWVTLRRKRMTRGQIAALSCAILLLPPGICLLVIGIGLAIDAADYASLAPQLPSGAALLALVGLLFWIAFRRRHQAPGAPLDAPHL